MNNYGFESGLKYWLIFLLAFVLIGYPPRPSILWGAIAGIAGGYIAAAWMQKEMPKRPPADSSPAASNTLMGRAGRRLQEWRQGQPERDRGTVFGMFRRKRRTLRDRR
ncbi:MAG: hypothetical protein F6K28_56355 [Microcoleus sp. SIO2G3]|nr:hypothetical protein [Microcoleus sp. SIO2G3]